MVEWKKLGEVMKIVRGASPRPITSYITSDSNGVNWIKIGDVEPGAKYITRSNEKVTKEGAQKSRYLHSGDFILSNSMSFGRPYILKIDGCIHDGWIAMSDFEKHLSSGYLYEVLNSNSVQSYWRMKANNGGAMTNLNSDIVKDTIIPIPSLEEQTRIVGILDTFTSAIDNLKEQIAQRRKQYEYYCSCFFSTEKWPENKIGELTKVFSCPRVFKDQWRDSGVPFWRSSDIMSYHNGVINPRGEVYISQSLYDDLSSKSDKIKEGDILVTGGGSIGIPYLKKDNSPLFVKDADLICIQKCISIIPKYLYHYFLSTDFKLYLKKITHDATIAHYTINQIKDTPIPLPPLSEQQRIVSILDTFEASIQNLEAQLFQREKQYEYYRNKLLSFE